jgi:uncharacterized membrane protein YbjE (DUF340 family)
MVSLIVIGLFILGVGIGSLFRKKPLFLKLTEQLVILVVFTLLFSLGVSVGADPRIVRNISVLGGQAIAISSGAILGSLLLAKLSVMFFRESSDNETKTTQTKTSIISKTLKILTSQSLWILLFFSAGIAGSLLNLIPHFWGNEMVSTNTLYILMILVGSGIGSDPRAMEIMRRTTFRIFLIPIIVIIGSIGGSWLVSLLIANVDATNAMAIGAGFGYYSLSAIFIGNISSGEMGVIALLANIFREVITLVAAPFMVKWFGKLGAIASGGATAMDTTLPVIIKATGKEYAIISIFSGIVLSLLVPILVPLILRI